MLFCDQENVHAVSLHRACSMLRAKVHSSVSQRTSSSRFQVTPFPLSIHVSITTNSLDSAPPASSRTHFTLSLSPKPTPTLSQLAAILGRNASMFCVVTSGTGVMVTCTSHGIILYTRTQEYMYTQACTCINTCKLTHTHTCTHKGMHTHTCTHYTHHTGRRSCRQARMYVGTHTIRLLYILLYAARV